MYRPVDLQGVFAKIGDFMKCKGFLLEFLENRRLGENQKIARKVDLSEPRLLQCTQLAHGPNLSPKKKDVGDPKFTIGFSALP